LSVHKRQAGMPVLLMQIHQVILLQALTPCQAWTDGFVVPPLGGKGWLKPGLQTEMQADLPVCSAGSRLHRRRTI